MLELANPGVAFDWTPVLVAAVPSVFGLIGILLTFLINSRMKDKQAAEALNNGLMNGLGVIEKAIQAGLTPEQAQAKGVDYVKTQVGTELKYLGITEDNIPAKLDARDGVQIKNARLLAEAMPKAIVSPTLYKDDIHASR